MRSQSIIELCRKWNQAEVHYLIVGGLAVVAHGYLRATQDIDVVLDFAPESMLRAVQVLEEMGFTPRLPVPMKSFADPVLREQWIREKDMTVFTVWRNSQPIPDEVDIFVSHPFDFTEAWQCAHRQSVPDGTILTFVDRNRLIDMKRIAGRQKDLLDISELERLS